jgi:hypothetical protein
MSLTEPDGVDGTIDADDHLRTLCRILTAAWYVSIDGAMGHPAVTGSMGKNLDGQPYKKSILFRKCCIAISYSTWRLLFCKLDDVCLFFVCWFDCSFSFPVRRNPHCFQWLRP